MIRMMKSRRMRWAGNVARMEEKRDAYRILVGETEGKRALGRTRHRWVDNIVTCWLIHATKMTGSSLDDWIY
jgi:hypothetical protein